MNLASVTALDATLSLMDYKKVYKAMNISALSLMDCKKVYKAINISQWLINRHIISLKKLIDAVNLLQYFVPETGHNNKLKFAWLVPPGPW